MSNKSFGTPFGGGTSSTFGQQNTGFGTSAPQQPLGITVKFKAPTGGDTMLKAGMNMSVDTKLQCITAMEEYENKSMEELYLEDYQAGRKGRTNPPPVFRANTATSSASREPFGATAPNASFSFNQNKTTSNTSGQVSAENLEELDVIVVTQSQTNFSCPLTTVEMVKPVKNKKCNHHYDKKAIVSLIKYKHSQKKKCRCPVVGCANSDVEESDLVRDKELRRRIQAQKRNGKI